jgi:hypothetical protein
VQAYDPSADLDALQVSGQAIQDKLQMFGRGIPLGRPGSLATG